MKVIRGFVVLAAGFVFTGLHVEAQDIAQRRKAKVAADQAGVRSWATAGHDPSAVLAVMEQVKSALDAREPKKVEALLDSALKMLSDPTKPGIPSPRPIHADEELAAICMSGPSPS